MLNDLKELDKFLKICRKQGVTEISFNGVLVKFGDMPSKVSSAESEGDEIPSDALSPDELIYYATANAGPV